MNGIHPGVGAVDLQWRLYEERQRALKAAANDAAADTRDLQQAVTLAAKKAPPAPKPVF